MQLAVARIEWARRDRSTKTQNDYFLFEWNGNEKNCNVIRSSNCAQTFYLVDILRTDGISAIENYYAFDKSLLIVFIHHSLKFNGKHFTIVTIDAIHYVGNIRRVERPSEREREREQSIHLITTNILLITKYIDGEREQSFCIHEFNGKIENLSYARATEYQKYN